jgi:hypothetical protein
MMSYAWNAFVAVYQVLDDVLGAPVAPPGARATVHSIIDDLRMASAPSALIAEVEQVSIEMHLLELATARGDGVAASRARHALREIAEYWLDYCAA